MMQACDILNILWSKNSENPAWINRNLYRILYTPSLHVMAYERLKSKPGNMTAGSDGETLDGYSWETIEQNIELLKSEQYQPNPVRRKQIPKANGKYRPLGIPSPRDKIIQECIRLILEAIYEPHFHENSHGFRVGRSCHTALESLRRNWVGTKWVIEADIHQCFDTINHQTLLDTLREKIADDRFINLIRKFLTAGYMENWQYHKTHSGTPQGSVISPILTNIYMDKLDKWLEEISQQYSKGKRRKANPEYSGLFSRRKRILEMGESHPELREQLQAEIRELNCQILQTASYDYHDNSYIRMKFIRYADDVTIGLIGSKEMAEEVRDELALFLKTELKLDLNLEKTKLVHLASEKAEFLGYAFKTSSQRYRRRNLQKKHSPHNIIQTVKTTSGNIQLLVPFRKISEQLKFYMTDGKPRAIPSLLHQSVDQIIEHFNSVIRGWYNYYQLAENVSRLNYARYILQYSLARTLAHKENSSVSKIFQKYGRQLSYLKANGKAVRFFDKPLIQAKKAKNKGKDPDLRPENYSRYTRTRLQDNCAICNSPNSIEMHHVRHIRKRGQSLKGMDLYLAAINRKQIPVCRNCHRDIHNGRYDGKSLKQILDEIETNHSKYELSS